MYKILGIFRLIRNAIFLYLLENHVGAVIPHCYQLHCLLSFVSASLDFLENSNVNEQARHMVIPYMPMLIPPVKWTGYYNIPLPLVSKTPLSYQRSEIKVESYCPLAFSNVYVLVGMIKVHTCISHHMSCALMVQNNSEMLLRGLLLSS